MSPTGTQPCSLIKSFWLAGRQPTTSSSNIQVSTERKREIIRRPRSPMQVVTGSNWMTRYLHWNSSHLQAQTRSPMKCCCKSKEKTSTFQRELENRNRATGLERSHDDPTPQKRKGQKQSWKLSTYQSHQLHGKVGAPGLCGTLKTNNTEHAAFRQDRST